MRKTILFFSTIALLGGMQSCENNEAVAFKSKDELRQNKIELQTARSLKRPGKIYVKDDVILINEQGKGIHIVHNADPSAPKNVGFVKIPGNIDVAVKGDVIFADNYMDLVTLNTKTGQVNRVKGAFKEFERERREFAKLTAQGESFGMRGTQFQAVNHSGPSSSSGPGTGGSMARFAVVDNTLYVLDGNKLKVYDVTDPESPMIQNTVQMDFTVETVFPHKGKLFIGGTEGMYIYDGADPMNPKFISQFEHAIACDPVVVEGDFAYVTLRSGGPCNRAINQLDIVDISDIKAPKLVSNTQMSNPRGLSVQDNILYLCDGNQGLKVFGLEDKKKVSKQLKYADHSIRSAYDVIPLPNMPILLVVGRDGIYQYDAIDPENLVRISEINIEA